MVEPATAAGIVTIAPSGTRKQSWVATPKPSGSRSAAAQERAGSAVEMPRASNARDGELAGEQPARRRDAEHRSGDPADKRDEADERDRERGDDTEGDEPRGSPRRPPEPGTCSGTSPPRSSSTARQMRS